jgi:pyrroloquinoline quinone biosynthesis protein B
MRYIILFCWLNFYCLAQNETPYVIVLGVAQDGGYPHLGCEKECCNRVWKNDSLKKNVVALALVDPNSKKWFLFEATPDINKQLQLFKTLTNGKYNYLPSGIFITHAHIGHYTGLMQLGREVFNTNQVPVYVLPKLKSFLESNGPWSQLVNLKNITLHKLNPDSALHLSEKLKLEAFIVPHRDEYSETGGFKIMTGNSSYLFIPDIDKWQKWNRSIVDEVKKVDHAFVDATFYEIDEIKGRNISEVPHPFVSETISLFAKEKPEVKSKLVFIHFNHTNRLIRDKSVKQTVTQQGFRIAEEGAKY